MENNREKYDLVFKESFGIEKSKMGAQLEYNSISAWDSVGHMGLIAAMEEKFEIMMEMDDIIDFSSFEKGMEILKKYNITIE